MDVTVYNLETGRIERIITASISLAQNQAGYGESWLVGSANPCFQYVDLVTGLIAQRPTMPGTLDKPQILADGLDLATISNLPQPCTVTFAGQTYLVEDGEFAFTADIHGSYIVEVEAFPHLPATFTVEAIEHAN